MCTARATLQGLSNGRRGFLSKEIGCTRLHRRWRAPRAPHTRACYKINSGGGETGRFFMVSPPAVSLDSGQSAGCGRCCGGKEEGTRGEPSGGPECEGMRRWDGETVRGCAGLWVCKISHCHLIYHQFTKQQLLSWIIWRTSRTRHNGSKSYFQKKKPMYVQDKRR